MLKSILFTHDDLDGAGSRVVYELAHAKETKGVDYDVVNCTNAGIDNEVMETLRNENIDKNTEIIFADITAGRETLEYIINNFSMPKIFDHHRTNFFVTWIVPEAVIVPENELGVMQSGTSLLYQHYCKELDKFPTINSKGSERFLSDFVDTVRSYDTYEWKETNNLAARKLQVLFILLGMNRFCDQYIDRISSDTYIDKFNIIHIEDLKFVDAKLENEQNIIDSITPDDVYTINVGGRNAAFALGSFGVSVSELAHQFLNKYPDKFDMFISFNLWRGGEFSIRTIRDDIDVGSDIAAPLGGGGHPQAAGVPLPEYLREEMINKFINFINNME